jgi:hypothetical protein
MTQAHSIQRTGALTIDKLLFTIQKTSSIVYEDDRTGYDYCMDDGGPLDCPASPASAQTIERSAPTLGTAHSSRGEALSG